ncbi:MAG: DUF1800 family protein, partial [Herpetosiphonaceae bacterium]|nr:DUF1800 family protein [Herpetosiphonaceae bacterium]
MSQSVDQLARGNVEFPNLAPDAIPEPAVIALNRMAYGPKPGDVARVRTMGLTAYVDEQLAPNAADDPVYNQKLADARLRISYAAGTTYPAVDELRPLSTLTKSQAQLWELSSHAAAAERIHPANEVRAATWLRARYSKWQLREVMSEFWHNHFNVNAYSDHKIAAMWPLYDREVIRANCMGNFRTLLEAVSTSVPMQYYLDNVSSKDGPANENFARELFELHTLGSDNYFNNLYDDWQAVPGASQGKPVGYIDQDVYEAARAFTGWTIENGAYTSPGNLPNTGLFRYYDAWNDNAQKIVLATFLSANQGPMAHGRKVL